MPIPMPEELRNERVQGAPNVTEAIRRRARYHESDWAHRHRIEDDSTKDVQVKPHTRRQPDNQQFHWIGGNV